VLSLAWAVAQLGWIAGTITLIIFSLITLLTSKLMADCYRYPDPIHGIRNHTYMEMVKNILGNYLLYSIFVVHIFITKVKMGWIKSYWPRQILYMATRSMNWVLTVCLDNKQLRGGTNVRFLFIDRTSNRKIFCNPFRDHTYEHSMHCCINSATNIKQ